MRCWIIVPLLATGCHLVAGLDGPNPDATTASSSNSGNSTGGTGGTGGFGGEAACSAGAPAYRDIVLADEPFAYWRLGDQGGTAKDELSAHAGTYYAPGYQLNQPGALECDPDTAVRFYGAEARILMDENVRDVAPLSLEAWIKPEGVVRENRYVISKSLSDTNGATGYALYVHDLSILTFVVSLNGTSVPASTTRFDIGAWNHVVATFDGRSPCLYVNGALVEPCSPPNAAVMLTTTDEPFKIGAYDTSGDNAFIGTIDEVAIYDAVLSDDRIHAHYTAGLQIER